MRFQSNNKRGITVTYRDMSTNEATFNIERCIGASCSSFSQQTAVKTQSATTTGRDYTFSQSNLVVGQSYTYRVRACVTTTLCSSYSAFLTLVLT